MDKPETSILSLTEKGIPHKGLLSFGKEDISLARSIVSFLSLTDIQIAFLDTFSILSKHSLMRS